MGIFVEIVKVESSYLCSQKLALVDVRLGSEYASDMHGTYKDDIMLLLHDCINIFEK